MLILHVVNSWLTVDSPDKEVNDRVLKKHHIDHCFDSLRQSIMCAADISPVPYNWVPSKGLALGSLGVPHMCRSQYYHFADYGVHVIDQILDYEDLVDWAMAPERDISGWDWSIKPSNIE